MTVFKYSGRNINGEKVSGIVDAASESSVIDQLIGNGVTPTSISKDTSSSLSMNINVVKWFQSTVPLEILIIFCRQMYSLTKAGVPLLRAMNGLLQNNHNKVMKEVLEVVHFDLVNGNTLSHAMRQHPHVFSSLFISMVMVGENTGRLDTVLLQLSEYYEQELESHKRIKTAIRYPFLVVIFILTGMVILNIFVIPQFTSIFARFGTDLPLPTRILMATSDFFVNFWEYLLAVLLGAGFACRAWIKTDKGQEKWSHFKLVFPIFGDIVNRTQMARFSRTFALMLKSGVPLNKSITLSAESLGNLYLEKCLLGMKEGIESGSSVSITAMQSGIFTSLVLQMITVGEETGQIDELLLEVAEFYDREVDYDLKTLTSKIEPILLILVASMVLMLALGIFLPMWDMLDIIQK